MCQIPIPKTAARAITAIMGHQPIPDDCVDGTGKPAVGGGAGLGGGDGTAPGVSDGVGLGVIENVGRGVGVGLGTGGGAGWIVNTPVRPFTSTA